MSSDEYLMGVRIGRAMYKYEFLEEVVKDMFKDEYKIYKYKLRRLGEIEAKELYRELLSQKDFKDINAIRKYVG